jgi:hypothetical protein
VRYALPLDSTSGRACRIALPCPAYLCRVWPCIAEVEPGVGGGERIHPETARKSGRHGVQQAAHREGICSTGAGSLAEQIQILSLSASGGRAGVPVYGGIYTHTHVYDIWWAGLQACSARQTFSSSKSAWESAGAALLGSRKTQPLNLKP